MDGDRAANLSRMTESPRCLGRREFLRDVAAVVVAGSWGLSPSEGASGVDVSRRPFTRLFSARVAVEWMSLLQERVRLERLSPPVASRVYAYAGVALYEAVVGGMPAYTSLAGRLNGMPGMPKTAGTLYDWEASASAALAAVAPGSALWASADTRASFDRLAQAQQARLSREEATTRSLEDSITYGAAVGQTVLGWAARDGFAATRTLPYTPAVSPAKWGPTPPTLAPPLEPHWGTLRPFALEAPESYAPDPPIPYAEQMGSDFYLQAFRTCQATKKLTAEQLEIALFWADNPGETGTPPGHWMAIANQFVTALDVRLDEAAEMYVRVGVALADAFIACWHAKYRVNMLRPITYVRRHIDPRWSPLLLTPPFPEYTSGHSVASAAAAEVLARLFGDVPFIDRTHDARGFRARSFGSTRDAAAEAAISRLYGGIHYPMSIEAGVRQGQRIGRRVAEGLRTRRGS